MPTFSKASKAFLSGVHPDLVKVLNRAIEITKQDFKIICGVRTIEQQRELYAQGRTKPGKIVTWTLNSNHLKHSDGYGHAVDVVPYPVDWNTLSKFIAIAEAIKSAAKELGVSIRWGSDWDMDNIPFEKGETDSGHFELNPKVYG